MNKYILTLDQGTTSSRAIVFDNKGQPVSSGQVEFKQHYPKPGWVEYDPWDIWESQISAMDEALEGIAIEDIVSIGITNQRETTIIWERESGKPVFPAIGWQCRRTSSICDELKNLDMEDYVRSKTGLIIDAYFSGTKIKWILDNDPTLRKRAESGELCFGTVDSWLLFNLTEGKAHATDYTNASRTMLFDINKLEWDEGMLQTLNIPRQLLPKVKDTSGLFGVATIKGKQIPIMSMVGDQQSALFGQTCFKPGDIKNTYGTGCFILLNTGKKRAESSHGLLSTIAYKVGEETVYALEGSVFNAGSAISWLKDEMELIGSAAESDICAAKVKDSGGVYFVPAFTGLGAPYWDMYARGTAIGITRGTTKSHFTRAVLESLAYQSADVINLMREDAKIQIDSIFADGGASVSNIIMQFQADILDISVKCPVYKESTSLGAAFLAGLASGVWKDKDELKVIHVIDKVYKSKMTSEERKAKYDKWLKAVDRSRGWADGDNNEG